MKYKIVHLRKNKIKKINQVNTLKSIIKNLIKIYKKSY